MHGEGREIAITRSLGKCELCGGRLDQWHGLSVHHRRPRGMGGSRDPKTNSASNLIVLCGSATSGCHGKVEKNRADSKRDGLIVSSWSDPASVPILLNGTWWTLTDDGDRLPSPEPQ